MKNLRKKEGITLIALIITIIVLLILSAVGINLLLGENGIIEKTKEASFKTRFRQVEESVQIYKVNKEAESMIAEIVMSNVDQLPVANKLSNSDKAGLKNTLKKEIQEISGTEDILLLNLYYIDKKKINTKYEYIINVDTMQLYDVKGEKYYGKMHHTLNGEGQEDEPKEEEIVQDEEIITIEGDIGWYSPNMNGFNINNTFVEYYNSSDYTDIKEINVKEYIESGKQSKIEENGKIYILDDYENKICANVKTTGNELEAWWVWIPRYAYMIENITMNIIFVDLNNKPIGTKYGDVLPEGYIVHPAFTPSGEDGSKNLQGIWMSKYEASYREQIRYSGVLAPDMTGFNRDCTYIELYNKETRTFDEEVLLADANLDTINDNNKWYDYENKIWANVKTTGNELEAWWVWIPRYAYCIDTTVNEMEIIFVDLNNRPIETEKYGNVLPEGYIVHPAFTPSGEDGSKNLQGIWMSKYEASEVDDVITGTIAEGNTDLPYASDTEGLQHTHIGNGAGTKLRYVTSSTKWCNAYDGTPCSNYGYYIYCSECGVRLRHFWCAKHYGPSTKVIINDENVE